ncbi:MAG: hypothetical protein H0S79_21790 [Anaerolineaceae bacterium]|nr:hypothetical protein [Anaerolineaceae bacterium]
MMKRQLILIPLIILSVVFLAGCDPVATPSSEPPQNDGEFIYGQEATFEFLEVVILESFPVRVMVTVTGYLPDGCVVLDEISSGRDGFDFTLMAATHRPAGDVECTEALVPFTETVELEVLGLEAGTYTVHAQEQTATFELAVDNVLEEPVIGDQEGPASEVIQGTVVYLNSMDILIMESFPVQVSVTLQGDLPDGCTTIQSVESSLEAQTFTIIFRTHRPAGQMCTQALVPFEETVSLDVYGLPAGEYTVIANDLTETFTLDVDNTP